MPQKRAVSSSILELIKSLQGKKYLTDFYLVGGTALALYYNHRISVDIDLFSNFAIDAERMLEHIQQDYNFDLFFTAEHTLKGRINDINVDIIAHRYHYLDEPKNRDGILMLSEPDIIAMKLNAISVSGQRSKDFIDIYYVLENHTISEMIQFYKTKYRQESVSHVLKSLIYFDDVDLADWPVMIRDPKLQWSTVKQKIEKEVMNYLEQNMDR